MFSRGWSLQRKVEQLARSLEDKEIDFVHLVSGISPITLQDPQVRCVWHTPVARYGAGHRRVRLLALTESGRAVKDAAQAAIQRDEERWLGTLPAAERRVFLRVLAQLSTLDTQADR